MSVLVDTSVWSAALRRKNEDVSALTKLIESGRVRIIGPIRQELLSGIKEPAQFEKLKHVLSAFPDHPLTSEHFEEAAAMFNECRRSGIQASHIDFLITAVSILENFPLLTYDQDFKKIAEVTSLRLFSI